MAEISIPGVSDKYKTNELIEGLMKVERVPLTREQKTLDGYKDQQSAWRGINQKMSSLRETVKTLYSFENPFNSKISSSTDEAAVTATPDRTAEYGDFKVDVVHPATADRFLSAELEKGTKVPEGTYTYLIGDKSFSVKWKGGSLEEFANSLNKRGTGLLKASLIGTNKANKSLLIESQKTGAGNGIVFEKDALKFAIDIGMMEKDNSPAAVFGNSLDEVRNPTEIGEQSPQAGMPSVSANSIRSEDGGYAIPPRGGMGIDIPAKLAEEGKNMRLVFDIGEREVDDITIAINEGQMEPDLPGPGYAEFGGVTVQNNLSEDALPEIKPRLPAPLEPVDADALVCVRNKDGTIEGLPIENFEVIDGKVHVDIDLRKYPKASGIEVQNPSTGKELSLSPISAFEVKANAGYMPSHPISEAADSVIKYEGVTITRPTNEISDVVPNVKINVHAPTQQTATISIRPDAEAAKEALVTFVGKYNQVMAEINILTQNKPDIVSELEYLSKEEREESMERLGIFLGDTSLNSGKGSLQRIISGSYAQTGNKEIQMLSQIGISTNAAGSRGSYAASQLRGYLEIDEKKLDSEIESHLDQIKSLFGFDSDGDMIIDNGIGKQLDTQLTAWVQTGGLIANKTGSLDRKISTSETKIKTLEGQLARKESQLRQKYGAMEGSLNSLQSQSNSLSNFANRQNNNRN